jgi:hypothetical protein
MLHSSTTANQTFFMKIALAILSVLLLGCSTLQQVSPAQAATKWIKEEARKYGANIIQIVYEGGTSYAPYVLSTELYRLQEPALTAFRRRLKRSPSTLMIR